MIWSRLVTFYQQVAFIIRDLSAAKTYEFLVISFDHFLTQFRCPDIKISMHIVKYFPFQKKVDKLRGMNDLNLGKSYVYSSAFIDKDSSRQIQQK